jgi:N-acetylmuramoyl-L-alanine amidase
MLKKIWALLFLFLVPILHASITTPKTEFQKVSNHRIDWRKDGVKRRVIITTMDGRDYVSVTQMAAISAARADWQPVTGRVCLNRLGHSLCFDWTQQKDIVHHSNEVYLPAQSLLSEDFQRFSGTTIVWDEKGNQFLQDSPISVVLPPVEKSGDNYFLRLPVADGVRYELLQQDTNRVWVRFVGGRSAGSAVLEGDNVIRSVRLHQRRKSADVLIYFGGAALSNDVYFDEKEKKIVVNVRYTPDSLATPIPVSTPNRARASPAHKQPRVDLAVKKTRIKPVSDSRIRTVVIDAGHGGQDAGAIGVRGTYEKDINLKVAQLLAERLQKEKNIRVILTRDSDEFVPLMTRTQIANDARADLFISIHCNSSLSSKHNGLELYVLSPEASDEAAEAVARLENSVIAFESKRGENSDKLSTLLASMAINNYINESLECAMLLSRAAKEHAALSTRAIKEANFYVLRGAQMPGVLVELEYVSNPISELKLRSSRYRSQLAKALAAGLVDIDQRFRTQQEGMAARSGALRSSRTAADQ